MRKMMLSLCTLGLTALLASCGEQAVTEPALDRPAAATATPQKTATGDLHAQAVAGDFTQMTTASPNLVQLAQTFPLERAQDRQWYIDYFGLVYSHSGYSDPTSDFASQWVDFYRVTRPVSDFQWSIAKSYWKEQLPMRLDLQDPANKQSVYIAYKIFDMDWGGGVRGIYPILKPDWKTAR